MCAQVSAPRILQLLDNESSDLAAGSGFALGCGALRFNR
jgi:hypothetical protein